MATSGIYKIQSKSKPNRIYIGSAVNIRGRWSQHKWYLRRNKHHTSKLQRHYNKYGESDLVFTLLITCEVDELLKYEQFFIDSLNPFFNTCKIAGNTKGFKASDETKSKLSKIGKGRIPWNKGKHLSEEHKRHIGEKQLGENNSFFNREHSDDTKRIIGEKSKKMHELRKQKTAA